MNSGITPTLTDIKDPKIDEKPPPYECSNCGFSTWSWNEAKKHRCGIMKEELKKVVEAGRAAKNILSAFIGASVVKPLIQILEKAHDGSKGEFKESTITLPSKSGRPIILQVRRGAPESQGPGEKSTFSIDLEITQE